MCGKVLRGHSQTEQLKRSTMFQLLVSTDKMPRKVMPKRPTACHSVACGKETSNKKLGHKCESLVRLE